MGENIDPGMYGSGIDSSDRLTKSIPVSGMRPGRIGWDRDMGLTGNAQDDFTGYKGLLRSVPSRAIPGRVTWKEDG